MTTVHSNGLVADYLRRLERAAASLTRSRRAELVAEIREHIDDALFEAGATDEVAVRNVLERLGPPEEIAAAAGPAQRRSGSLELAAMIALAIPIVGWFVGIALVAASRAWTGREKAVAIALALLPAVLLAVGFMAESAPHSSVAIEAVAVEPGVKPVPVPPPGTLPEEQAGGDGGLGPVELVFIFGSLLAGPLASVFLASRLRRTAEPAST